MKNGQALHTSPYVTQIEKYADSIKQLSRTFLHLEEKKSAFSNEEIEDMFDRTKERACKSCEKCSWCWEEDFVHTYQMGYEVLSAIDHYGSELNTETKRKLQQRCLRWEAFLQEMLGAFHDARQNMMWNNRIVLGREGCAVQMDTFADMLRSTAKELEKSLFSDERLEKKLASHLKKRGIRVLYSSFFLNREGKYEVHLTARAVMRELGGGKLAVALSDGMGSGEKACRESTLVMELLEELLEAGFPAKAAIQMINTTLVMGREEIHFSTVDLSMFDLYTGECRLIKAGASSTFIKKGNKVERISSSSLPIGVMHSIEIESVQRTLEDGDFVVMITDGVLDALPVGEQDLLMETIIGGTTGGNPKELAHHILEQVLNWTGEEPMDDMTVLAVGIWNCQDTCILGTDSV